MSTSTSQKRSRVGEARISKAMRCETENQEEAYEGKNDVSVAENDKVGRRPREEASS